MSADPTVIAAAVADRIIAEIRKSIDKLSRDLQEFQRTSGGTLDDLMKTIDGIADKFTSFERRMNSYEKKTDARITRIEREIERARKKPLRPGGLAGGSTPE